MSEQPKEAISGQADVVLAKQIELFQPTGDLLADLGTLYGMRGHGIDYVFTDQITGAMLANFEDPESVYQFFQTPESKAKLDAAYEDALTVAHVSAVKRIIKKYEEAKSK